MALKFRSVTARVVRTLAMLTLLAATAVNAGTLVASPAKGKVGTAVRVSASGLAPSATFELEFVGSPATKIAELDSSARGELAATVVLPTLPVGGGKLRLKTMGLGSTVAAYTAFTALPTLTFRVLATPVHAGQSVAFEVNQLAAGTLLIDYEGRSVLGPIAVAAGRYQGKFPIPTDRPASLPANVRIRISNRVGKATINQLDTTLGVQPKLGSPLSIGITRPPLTQPRASQRLEADGVLTVAANEPAPTEVSLWYFGDDGKVFPLGSTQPQGSGAEFIYAIDGVAPGRGAMTAGQQGGGNMRVVGNTRDSHGRSTLGVQAPTQDRLDLLPPDRWRIRVKVTKPNGQPIPGAIVQLENAPIAGPDGDDGLDLSRLTSVADYLAQSLIPSQFPATDAQGCPITLARQIADDAGYVDFELTDEALALNFELEGPCNSDICDLNPVYRTARLAVDASAQGHGFQFTSGPNAGDFLPHVFRVEFAGVGDGDPGGDTVVFIDDYQNVPVLSGGRDITMTLPLPPIVPKVALFDVAIKPWLGASTTTVANSGDQGWAAVRQVFGPVHSLPTSQPYASWVEIIAAEPYPTEITVRTDPAVTGRIPPGNAKLFLDMNRDGQAEQVATFSSSSNALDCTIAGLDQSLTWRATLPSSLKNANPGLIAGLVEFAGEPGAGRARKQIAVQMIEPDLSWLADSKYSARHLYYRHGGQSLVIEAVEDTPDAAIQLNQDPGYEIGRLGNKMDNSRLVNVGVLAGVPIASAPLDGAHKEAGRTGAPTLVEVANGVTYGPETTTLIDQSFPLFYYVWGIPLLAGVELGADFSLLAQLELMSKFKVAASREPQLSMLATPSMDLGLNFYLDLDVLFDLIDGGVDLDAVFELDMPVEVSEGETIAHTPNFDASLLFSWHFEVWCLPLEPVCNAIPDIDGCERLLPPEDNRPCLAGASKAADAKAELRDRPIGRSVQPALAYSPTGAGLMAYTRQTGDGSAPPELVVRPIDGGDFTRAPDQVVLSSAPGIRSVALAYYRDDRAVAVWAENADSYATMATRTPVERIARQHLMYASWDGENWSTKLALTPANGGDGGVALAACVPSVDPACPVDGEVLAAWTHDTTGDITRHRSRVYSARLIPSRGWTTPQPVDATALLDSAPSATYVGTQPVVAFVRSTSGVFGDTDARRVAYRFLQGTSGVQVPAALPGGAAWPSIVGLPDGGFAIAHTHAADAKTFVGNRQRAALAFADACISGACNVVAQAVTDDAGRPVYGERPTALLDGDGGVSVVMRGTGFGPGVDDVQQRPDDLPGMALHTGELISFAVGRGQSVITPRGLSNDGAVHYAPTAAYDPQLRQVVAFGTRGESLPQQLRSKLAAAGNEVPMARASANKVTLAGTDLELIVYTAEQGVDFSIEAIDTSTVNLAGSRLMSVSLELRNVGDDYVATGQAFSVALSFDAPPDAGGTMLASRTLPSLVSGAATTLAMNITVPSTFAPDQSHRLYARVLRNGSSIADVDASNDQRERDFGGMPMPFGLTAAAVAGAGIVQLTWDPIADPLRLIAGYRVWFHDGDGVWRHLGSSFNLGLVDFTATEGVQRHYRVTSYSRGAIESPPSTEAVATSSIARQTGLFDNSFEG